jgi:hypothetical protein
VRPLDVTTILTDNLYYQKSLFSLKQSAQSLGTDFTTLIGTPVKQNVTKAIKFINDLSYYKMALTPYKNHSNVLAN